MILEYNRLNIFHENIRFIVFSAFVNCILRKTNVKILFFLKKTTICSNVYEAATLIGKTYCKFTDFVHMEEDL